MKLPDPDKNAQAVSEALCRLIASEIEQRNGWISFARYMELALYSPALGYYSGGAVKLGREGDFTTSPEISPLFAAALAYPVSSLIAQTTPHIMEFGAGSGKLARDLLTELAHLGVFVEQYAIVDLSGEFRARQQEMLHDFPQVIWLDHLPDAFSGVVIGNEVLDAMPVQLVRKSTDGWHEIGVALENGQFAYHQRICDSMLQAQIQTQIPDADSLPDGYLTEVHTQAIGFIHTLAAMIVAGDAGAAIFIDYGFPAHEYYLEQRAQGTLMCHYRHHAHPSPFWLPGLQDITAHVDFTLTAQAEIDGGLDLLCYMNQASFLMAACIGNLLLRTSPEDAKNYLPQSGAVQKLLSPSEMGELFKVLVLGKNVVLPEVFGLADRSYRL